MQGWWPDSVPGFLSQEVSSDSPPHVCRVICEYLPANRKQQWNSLSYTEGACVGPCFQQCIMLLKWRCVPKGHWSHSGTGVKRGMLMRMPAQSHYSASHESTAWNQVSSARRRRTQESKFKLKCFKQNKQHSIVVTQPGSVVGCTGQGYVNAL